MPPLGNVVPLPGARWREGPRDTARSSRRCGAKPLWCHGLQRTDDCQTSEHCANLASRRRSGNTTAAGVWTVKDTRCKQRVKRCWAQQPLALTQMFPRSLLHYLNCVLACGASGYLISCLYWVAFTEYLHKDMFQSPFKALHCAVHHHPPPPTPPPPPLPLPQVTASFRLSDTRF